MCQSFELHQDIMEAQYCLPATISYVDETIEWSPPAKTWFESETSDLTIPARSWTVNETKMFPTKTRISLKARAKSPAIQTRCRDKTGVQGDRIVPSKTRVKIEAKPSKFVMSRPAHVITDFNKLQKPTPIQEVAPVPRAAPPTKPVCNNNILISIQKGKQNQKADEKVRLRKNRKSRRRSRENGDSFRRFAIKNAWRASRVQ
eukprot:XP_011683714.1 PREDICTED: uncharacterized protein LOC105447411 [Strongylocentrotus purpuratus]